MFTQTEWTMGLQYGIIDVYPDRVDYSVNNVRFGTSDIVELNYNKETQRNLLSAEHTLDIQAPSISFNGTLENVYTKTECDEKFGGGGGTIPADLSVNTLTLNNTTGLTLRGVKFSSTNEWAVIASCVLDDSPRELFSIHQDGRIRMDRFWSLSMGRFSYDIIDDNPIMHIMSFGGDYSGGIPSKLLIQAGTIEFDGTLANVYTKAEVDEKIPVKERGANTWYGYELTRSKENSKFCFYIGTSGENCATLIFDPTDKHFGIGLLNGGDNEMLKFYANNTAEFTCKVSAPNISCSIRWRT